MLHKKATAIFNKGLETAQQHNEIDYLHIYIDSVKYSKKLKLQIIEVAKEMGYLFKLDGERLFNSYSRRHFICNNIIKIQQP